jgi:serine/threonine protein kinase
MSKLRGIDQYVRVCPVCGAEHSPAASQCGCGTLLIGVDLTMRAPAQPASAAPPTEAPLAAPTTASIVCPHADCGAANPPGQGDCLYCGRRLGGATPPASAAPAVGLYNLPAALAANFTIERVLPAGGAEAELMLLKGLKTGVRVMAKLYRPGIAPKGRVLERVAGVAHAHVVRLLAHGVSDGTAYEVMEYCAGGSLRDLMNAAAPTPERLNAILSEIAEAVAALHDCQVIHRDLKPENVLVRRTEPLDLVLTDFGIASLQDATQLFTGTARTARYAAPEAMTGVLDTAADYWSLGMILVELLAGAHPFAGLSDAVVAHRLATGTIDTDALVDPAWRRLCRGLLQRDPRQRWGIAEIRRWLAKDPTLPEPAASAAPLAHAYRIQGEECRTLPELAAAFSRHWEAAGKDLVRGHFETWVREDLRDHDLNRFLHDLKERGGSTDLHLFRLIRHLAPGVPPGWRGVSLGVVGLLAMAAKAAQGDADAAGWLASVFDERVLELLPADRFDAEAALAGRWQAAWQDFRKAWRDADQALADWRNGLVARGEAIADIDALMFGQGGGLDRPTDGSVHALLLLARLRPEYLATMKPGVLAEAADHLEHSPWLAEPCRRAEADDAQGIAALVALIHLLPQARQASEDGQQLLASRREKRADDLGRLGQQVNESLASLRGCADELGLVFGEQSRERLAVRLDAFFALSLQARSLAAAGDFTGNPALRALARAEPLVQRMRERLEEWQSTRRINEVWRNEHVRNALVGAAILLLLFAPQWLPLALAAPALFATWRLWIVARLRGAIRQLAAGLPPRVTGATP